MLSLVAFLLSANVLAFSSEEEFHRSSGSDCFEREGRNKEHCEISSESDCRLGFGADVRFSNLNGIEKCRNEKNAVRHIANLRPFTDLHGLHLLPQIQFANIAQFIVSIPNKKHILPLFNELNIAHLVKLASRTGCFQNYDAYNALFYNADSMTGICKREFDSNYIQFFLVRFFYLLDLLSAEVPVVIRDNGIFSNDFKREIDFFNLPVNYVNLSFGSRENELKLFNSIITDTSLTQFLVKFINTLVRALSLHNVKTEKTLKCLQFNTFTIYIDLLRGYLLRTAAISEFNYKTKLEFLQESKVFVFADVPIQLKSLSQSEDNFAVDGEEESNDSEIRRSPCFFVEIYDFFSAAQLAAAETGVNQQIAVYTKPGLARFL